VCLTFRAPASPGEYKALAAEVAAMAAERGLELADRAAGFILDVCGNDLNRIAAELDKLSIWQGPGTEKKARIELDAARALVSGSGLLSGWELADALTSRDPKEAVASARRLLDAGDEPIRIVGGLASRARALLIAKAMTEAGAPVKAVVDASRAWYFREALATGLKRYTLSELLAMPGRLLAVDRTLKSRSLDKGAVLEALVTQLTRPSTER
jgi:DNA polymerase III delta subunit